MKTEIRPQRVSDANRFYEILSSPNFIYFSAKPKSIEDEKNFLKLNPQKRREKSEFNFSIIYNNINVVAVGVRIIQGRAYTGEIGYFIDEQYWGKGIATDAVLRLEEFIKSKLKLHRLEIFMAKGNKASRRIAIKCGYQREGLLKEMLLVEKVWHDCYLYGKIIS
ncbi:MAG: GNAT family N-acetyltransferase [Spirochaetes bacterium]|nr:GNAT family N-acetyltransferase [Spirochaetota bacterium]